MADAFILIKCDPSIVGKIRKEIHAALPEGARFGDMPFYSNKTPAWFTEADHYALVSSLHEVYDVAMTTSKKYAKERRRLGPKPVGARCTRCDRKIVTLTGKMPRLFHFMKRKGWKTLGLFLYCPSCAPADGTAPSIFIPSDAVAVKRHLLR